MCVPETMMNSVADDGNLAIPVDSLSARCHELLQVLTDATNICSDPDGLGKFAHESTECEKRTADVSSTKLWLGAVIC